jgi:DNA-3-methyladenine glycosylase I
MDNSAKSGKMTGKRRCGWPGGDALMIRYHDREWGVAVRDDRRLFEHLSLGGAQAGLSWRTILHKRARYREVFEGFDPRKIARFTKRDVDRLLGDAGIVRNRLKVESVVSNARALLKVAEREGSFGQWLWGFVDGEPIVNRPRKLSDLPATSKESDAMRKALKAEGFRFVGSTICYSVMQAAGLVNDHVVGCFRYGELARR